MHARPSHRRSLGLGTERHHLDCQRSERQMIARSDILALDALAVDSCAIGALEVKQTHFVMAVFESCVVPRNLTRVEDDVVV